MQTRPVHVNQRKVALASVWVIVIACVFLDLLRYFASGDLVLVRLDAQCLPAIVFSISGLVMKFDSKIELNCSIDNQWLLQTLLTVDRQLYHTCLLDKEYTERWVDAIDMIIYSVPV